MKCFKSIIFNYFLQLGVEVVMVIFFLLRISKSLMKRLLSAYNLEKCAAISWGITNEKTAIEKYAGLGASVQDTGINKPRMNKFYGLLVEV